MCASCYICRVSSCGVHVWARGYCGAREVECEGRKWKNRLPKTAPPQTGMGHFYTQESGMECSWSFLHHDHTRQHNSLIPRFLFKCLIIGHMLLGNSSLIPKPKSNPSMCLVSFPDPQQDPSTVPRVWERDCIVLYWK